MVVEHDSAVYLTTVLQVTEGSAGLAGRPPLWKIAAIHSNASLPAVDG